jgi:predicted ester cyclase
MSKATQQKNKAVVERAFDAWDDHDLDAFDEVYAEDVTHRNVDLGGLEALRRSAGVWFDAFPDLSHTVEAIIAEDDIVVARVRLSGTHEGESELYGGIDPTGAEVEMLGLFMERIEDGKIVERWVVENHYEFLKQLDAVELNT